MQVAASDLITLGVGLGAVLFAYLSWRRAGIAVTKSDEANRISRESNAIAKDALSVSEKQYAKQLVLSHRWDIDWVPQAYGVTSSKMRLEVTVVNHGVRVILQSVAVGAKDNGDSSWVELSQHPNDGDRLPHPLERNESWRCWTPPTKEGGPVGGKLFGADTVKVTTACGHVVTLPIKSYRELRAERITEVKTPMVFAQGPGPSGGSVWDVEAAERLTDDQYEVFHALTMCNQIQTLKDRGDWHVIIGYTQWGGMGKGDEGERIMEAVRALGDEEYIRSDGGAIWELAKRGQGLARYIAQAGSRHDPTKLPPTV